MKREDLRALAVPAIEAAFPVEPVPSVDEVRNDHCPECAELAARFSGRRWDEIAAGDLERNPSPSLLSPVAFRYYLPAIMLRVLEDFEALDMLGSSLVSALSPAGGKPSAHTSVKFAGITAEQASAIVAFLRYAELRQLEDAPDDSAGQRVVTRAVKYWSEVAGQRA